MIFLFRARAAAFNQVNIVKILLDSGADKEAKDMMDMTPFWVLLFMELRTQQSCCSIKEQTLWLSIPGTTVVFI